MISNCYLMSAISALAEYPARINRIIGTQKRNESGLYTVYLCRVGVFEEIIIDEYFPAKQGKKLQFCRTKTSNIWPMLIEKAYAKMFGAYWNIGLGGLAINALKDLTGAPSQILKVTESTDKDQLWEQLRKCLERDFIIVASSSSDEHMRKTGLVPWHA
jgi:calpain-15